MSFDIISRMNSRLSGSSQKGAPDNLTRDIGGFNRTNQPFISGYFQVIFHLPEKLFSRSDDAIKWLHSACEGHTGPNQTIDKVDVMGQGKIGSSFAASTTITREFTLTMREYQNVPVLNTIRTWAAMFNPHIGVSPLSGADIVPINYKGLCYVIQTKPSMGNDDHVFNKDNIEEIWAYDGVFPTTVPLDTVSAADINTNDVVQHSVTFSFDGFPLTLVDGGDELISTVDNLMKDVKYMTTFTQRHDTLTRLK